MYDYPYRMLATGIDEWTIYRTGEGRICTGSNFTHMTALMDWANAACQMDKTKNDQPQNFELLRSGPGKSKRGGKGTRQQLDQLAPELAAAGSVGSDPAEDHTHQDDHAMRADDERHQ